MQTEPFVYVTYIASTPEKVWQALTDMEFTRQYWEADVVADLKPGGAWELAHPVTHDHVMVRGEVRESAPPSRLVMSWTALQDPDDPPSLVSFDVEPVAEGMVRLRVEHAQLTAGSMTNANVRQGWPRVLCSLKSFLETGTALPVWAGFDPTAR